MVYADQYQLHLGREHQVCRGNNSLQPATITELRRMWQNILYLFVFSRSTQVFNTYQGLLIYSNYWYTGKGKQIEMGFTVSDLAQSTETVKNKPWLGLADIGIVFIEYCDERETVRHFLSKVRWGYLYNSQYDAIAIYSFFKAVISHLSNSYKTEV